jgi:energy-coupling factor transporter ATP-binding protein EcfA2
MREQSQMEAIKVDDLSIEYYTSNFRLENISLSIDEGEIVLLTGKSGSGKSTLLYCLSGLIPHCINVKEYHGAVNVNGQEISKMSLTDLTKNFGIVLQNPTSQIFGMTVEEDMAFGLENLCVERSEIKKRIGEALKFINLENYRKADPLSLSGGQIQRVALGSMLVTEPNILFLDEPTSNLDPRGTKEVLTILKKLKDKKKTIILVERKAEYIVPFVDRIIGLEDGKVVADLEPRRFFSNRDVVSRLGVSPPQVVRLAYQLIDEGVESKLPITVEEFCSAHSDFTKNKGGV